MNKIIKVIDEKKEVHIRNWNEEILKEITKKLKEEKIDIEITIDLMKGNFINILI